MTGLAPWVADVGPWVSLALSGLLVIGLTLVAPLGISILLGIDRRVSASMQLRIGPPVLQPWYDLTKLVSKRTVPGDRVAAGLLTAQVVVAAGALGMLLAGGDLVVAILVLGVATVAAFAATDRRLGAHPSQTVSGTYRDAASVTDGA